jgi:hypothetical protein|tara:strand:- start:213 stop:377 length:165 start_codon:yes stop_codon:yes gene_type:complete
MGMSRKHFEQLASIMKVQKADPYMIRAIAYFCANHNENFDYEKFYEASGLDEMA